VGRADNQLQFGKEKITGLKTGHYKGKNETPD